MRKTAKKGPARAARKSVAKKKVGGRRSPGGPAQKSSRKVAKKSAKKASRPAPTRGKRGPEFYERFRKRLLEERERIARRLDELREELTGLDETPRELEEWAQEEKDRDILIRLEERETDELRRIQASLQMIDSRDYGVCQVCGKPIPVARMEELPTAFRCVDCMS
ncbi:MAG TPA: TraR/DksA C4-type zinc finger protein [Gemmatimonadota bacterium]|nr:TraR/DksA C4-type zinc finger protein [Gemmatimonadota bacterium]